MGDAVVAHRPAKSTSRQACNGPCSRGNGGRADSLAREELGVRRISGRPSEFCHEGTIDLRVLTAPATARH